MPNMETLKCGKVDDFVYGGTHLHLQKYPKFLFIFPDFSGFYLSAKSR